MIAKISQRLAIAGYFFAAAISGFAQVILNVSDCIEENETKYWSYSAPGNGRVSYSFSLNSGHDVVGGDDQHTVIASQTYSGSIHSTEEGGFGCYTLVATFTPNLAITAQPVSLTVYRGNSASFTVGAVGDNPSFSWRKETTTISTSGATLSLTNVQPADAGNYSVVIADSTGSITSNIVTLTVLQIPPEFTLQPQSTALTSQGANVTLTSLATGVPTPTYQWRKNGVNIAGATLSSLMLLNVQTADVGSYTVVATNAVGAATSAIATLTIADPPPTAPSALNYVERTATTVILIWNAASDNIGVTGYNVYRGGSLIGVTTDVVYSDTGLSANTSYAYAIKASDTASQLSNASNTLSVTTTQDFSTDADHDGIPDAIESALYSNGSGAANPDTTNQTQLKVQQPSK